MISPAERLDLERQRDKVQAENAAAVNRRATIERLRETQPSGGLKLDARRIRLFADALCGEACGGFAHIEAERLFDGLVQRVKMEFHELAAQLEGKA